MKYLHLKLAIGIVVVFGLILLGYYVYEPIQFTYYKYQLMSDDPAAVQSAASAIAEKGKRAIPKIREWLRSDSDKLVIGACKVLENMSGDEWLEALPELEEILRGFSSGKTEIAAKIMLDKRKLFSIQGIGSTQTPLGMEKYGDSTLAKYETEKRIRLNIFIYLLKNSTTADKRLCAAVKLGKYGDGNSVPFLVYALLNDCDSGVRLNAANALGLIADSRAIPALVKALENESVDTVRYRVLCALLEFDDSRIVDSAIAVLKREKLPELRMTAITALEESGDARAVEPLIAELDNKNGYSISYLAAYALGKIGDGRAVEPLRIILQPGLTDEEIGKNFLTIHDAAAAIYAIDGDNSIELIYRSIGASGLLTTYHSIRNEGKKESLRKSAVDCCISMLGMENNLNLRTQIIFAIGEFGDNRAVEPLLNAIKNETESLEKIGIIEALSKLRDPSAADCLVDIYNKESDITIREKVAVALGQMSDKRAVEMLVNLLKRLKDEDMGGYYQGELQQEIVFALAILEDNQALEPLIEAYYAGKDSSSRLNLINALLVFKDERIIQIMLTEVRAGWFNTNLAAQYFEENCDNRAVEPLLYMFQNLSWDRSFARLDCAKALVKIGDKKAIKPIVDGIGDSGQFSYPYERIYLALALIDFRDNVGIDALESAFRKGNMVAGAALAWRFGGKYLENAKTSFLKHYDEIEEQIRMFLYAAEVRHGDTADMRELMLSMPMFNFIITDCLKDFYDRMPEGFSAYDPDGQKSDFTTQERQIRKWYRKNHDRLAWDAEKRKYYLKPEK
jgi:HEAT repeat protein